MPVKPKNSKPSRPNGISRIVDKMPIKNSKSNSKKNKKKNALPPKSVITSSGSGIIHDKDVKVNMPMVELMSYLQLVADNSNNLPLTRRDDPELGRTVSTLTTEEYKRKSLAFIPADVRIIGGAFTKYGRTWDLPTFEDYKVVDGAQEPGLSYGGACCNALLKVLYDAENEMADKLTQDVMDGNRLFEDDDDESLLDSMSVLDTRRQRSLQIGDFAAPSSLSFADLLRRMKSEMLDIDHAQIPKITANTQLDLNKPFALVPEKFNKETGAKRSLLIGCNYSNIEDAELKAAHDDIRSMKDYIVNVHGFPDNKDSMTILLDDDEHTHPTHKNITDAFTKLSEQSKPGDAIFIQFSGHGGRILELSDGENGDNETYDEFIVPSDFEKSGVIRDTLIFKTLFAPMKKDVTITILIDACDTGMMLELPFSWSTKKSNDPLAKMTLNDDFSFVRFLKVVKTLYETSTFTQLGNTVGDALNAPLADEDDAEDINTPREHEYDLDTTKSMKNESSGCSSWFANPFGSPSSQDDGSVRTRKDSSGSILQQVMNCTIGHDDSEDSDIDTFTGTFDGTFDEGTVTTFESRGTDNEEIRKKSKSRRKAKR